MGNSIDVMLAEWQREGAPSIPYHDPVFQLAYVYSHVAMNAHLLDEALRCEFPIKGRPVSVGSALLNLLKKTDRLRICTFGSGPGTELLGLSRFLGSKWLPHIPVELDVLHMDRVDQWAPSSKALQDSIESQFGRKRKLAFSTSFLPWNASKPDVASQTRALEERHLFLFSYVVSELLDQAELDAVSGLLSQMVRASPHAVFLIIDRFGDDRTQANISSLVAGAGLQPLAEDTLPNYVGFDEHAKTSLRQYVNVIGRMPRGSRFGGKKEAQFVIAQRP
ncbi:hypothetical protein WA016_06348 [Myxococcus stipitatus]